jgi:hypothetical protein
MDNLIAPLGAFSHLDEANRLRLQDGLHEAAEALETPYDMMVRLLNAVSYSVPCTRLSRLFSEGILANSG